MKTGSKLMIALAVLLAVTVGLALFNGMFKNPQPRLSTPEFLNQLVAEANPKLPVTVDADDRMDKVAVGANNVLIYYYTLPRITKSQLGNLSALQKNVRQTLLQNYKTSTTVQMQSLRLREVVLDYQYKDKNGDFIFEITISPKDF
jgi:hypothetical protein